MSANSPGGGEYGNRVRQSSRTRDRDRARLRALVLVLALALIATLTVWLIVRSDAKGKPSAGSPCVEASGSASKIKLRVLNATARDGLAASVAGELRKRGYTVLAVGNDSRNVPGSAEIRYGTKGSAPARAAVALVAGATSRNDRRTGDDIDLVLGTQFRALTPAKSGVSSGCPATVKATPSPRRT